uniref:Putative ovule protein n=1 Tax=Solanum chacoense TaxID=4108 RepID=A0A0V0H1G7_SOLCH
MVPGLMSFPLFILTIMKLLASYILSCHVTSISFITSRILLICASSLPLIVLLFFIVIEVNVSCLNSALCFLVTLVFAVLAITGTPSYSRGCQ